MPLQNFAGYPDIGDKQSPTYAFLASSRETSTIATTLALGDDLAAD